MNCRRAVVLILTILAFSADPAWSQTRPGLTVRNGILIKDGRPFRGIGVDYFDAFFRHLQNPHDTSYEAGFKALEDAGIPFVRMIGCGFWPVEQKLYYTNRAEFLHRFDDVVRAAEKYHVGLIPSLFWNESTLPDLMGEPADAWGDPASKTRAAMQTYVRDIVTRYRDSPAIWGWEFANEFNLGANLPNAAEHRPPIVPALGTPTSRSARDEWTYETIRSTFAAFAHEVRRYDPYRVISTGDAFPRESAWHNWKEKTWTADSPDQFAQMLQQDNPDPVDIISVHAYDGEGPRIAQAAIVAKRIRKPLFVGEFGAPGPPEKSEKEFTALLTAIEAAQVPLAAVWDYDREQADDPFSITTANDRSYQLRAISEANRKMAR